MTKRRIFITGCSAVFGYDRARALAERGHTVFATLRGADGTNKGKAKALRDFATKGGHARHVLELDVTDEASVARAASAALELGGVDVVINNAGVGVGGVQETFSVDQVKDLFDVNVFGVLRVNRALLPHLRERGQGVLVFISSGLGRIVFPFMGPYTATKFAIEALGQTAALELEPLGIKTVIVQPGAFGTTFLENSVHAADVGRLQTYGPVPDILRRFFAGFEERARAGQLGNPKDVVDALVKIVESDPAALPSRITVGEDVKAPVTAMNEVSDRIHDQLYQAFGLK